MIKREMYMKRIRPFIGTELIKVMTGIRRCGKSVMLELIKEELVESGIGSAQFISINFEDLNFSHLQTAKSLHDEITKRAADKEIDFVCDKSGEKLYVQVAYLLASDETVQREFDAYDNIRDNYPKYVVSLDEFDMSRNGIKHRNIRDFLLAEEWN